LGLYKWSKNLGDFKNFYGNCLDSNPSLPSLVRSQNHIMSHKSKEYIESSDEEDTKYV
jgi:hypothetical protein